MVVISGIASAANPVLQPFHLRDDFGGNTLSQWASYPPVEDVGYDPSLTPTEDYGVIGGRSLMRVVRAPSRGRLRFGFIKRLNAVASKTVTVSFAYRLTVQSTAKLEVALAGSDGRRYKKEFAATAGEWGRITAEFREIPAGINLEAVYLTATYARGDPDFDYRFLIDNFLVGAAERARFALETPKATAVAPWTSFFSSRTYAPGETIGIAAKAPVPLIKGECRLKDQENRTVAEGALEYRGGLWVNSAVHVVDNSDVPGVWHALLRGSTSDGREIETDLRLMVRAARADWHPRLYFDASGRTELMARTHIAAWDHLTALAKQAKETGFISDGSGIIRLLDKKFLLPTLPSYFNVLNRASDGILYNSLTGYVMGDAEAVATAKAALLSVAGWSSWAPPWFRAHGQFTYYPAGELTTVVAFAYDLLYPDLSPTERKLVRDALLERGIKPAYDEYVLNNRIMSNTSNWIGHSVGGAIVASLAVMEDKDDPELNTYLGGLLMKFEDHLQASYLADGSYGEGISYQEFDLKTTTLALEALQRVCGIDYWTRTHVKDSLAYPLYALADPVAETLDMGDSNPPSGYSIAPLVRHCLNRVIRWYYDRFKHVSINDFLFPPDAFPNEAPPAADSRVFEQKGNAIFRSGWSRDDAVLLFRAGPTFNHNHADQGSFQLRVFGETLVTEAGYSDYYKDPYYGTYFSQAAGHNTILVDGDSASQEFADTAEFRALQAYPRITDSITSSFYDAVGSELSSVYKGKLKNYTRRIVFLKPRYVVIYDDLASDEKPASFDWLLHVKNREYLHQTTNAMVYEGITAAMAIRAMQPENGKMTVNNGHIPFAVFNPVAPQSIPAQPGILDIHSQAASGSARFLVLLALSRSRQEALSAASGATALSGSGCTGLRVGGTEVFFRTNQLPIAQCGAWQTDASAWTAGSDILSAEQVTSLVKDGRPLLQSDGRVNFAARYTAGSIDLAISSSEPVTVRLHTGFRPLSMPKSRFDSRDGMFTIECPAGRRQFAITSRETKL